MVREKRKQKKSEENKKSNNKEGKQKIKNIKFFFGEFFFFWTETKRLSQKKQDIFQRHWKKKSGKMILKIMHEKTNLQQKWFKSRKTRVSFKKELFYATFVQQPSEKFLYEARKEDWYKKI